MNKLILSISFFCTFLSATSQIILSEDFQGLGGVMPAGWTLINQDGLTPNPSVGYVNNAWIVREDFNFNVTDSAAFSTSWYAPEGTANDWMITPLINLTSNNLLSWNAVTYDVSYPDGYEVRISTTTPDIAGFNAHPPLFTVAAEATAWTTHSVNLATAGYANQPVYIAWRNNSVNQFILLVDDILVEQILNYDIELTSAEQSEYTITPLSQIGSSMTASGLISNNGLSSVTNVGMTLNVFDGAMTNVFSGNSTPLPTMAVGGSSTFTVTGFTPATPDVYTFELITSMSEIDQEMLNDTLTYQVVITDSIYARDNGVVTGSLGIGGGTGGDLGQSFEVVTQDYLTSVSFFMVNSGGLLNGQKVVAHIWDMAAGVPNNLIGLTDSVLIANNVDSLYTVDINSDYLNLTPGFYTITIGEQDSTLSLANTDNIFTPGTTWVNWPTNPFNGWSNTEDFGQAFAKSFILRANFGDVCFPTTNSFSESTCQTYTSPSGAIYTVSGIYNDTILNVNGCDSIMTINLTILEPTTNSFSATTCLTYTSPSGEIFNVSGIYNDTIPNVNGCDSIMTINLTILESTTSSFSVTSCGDYTAPSGAIYNITGIYNDTIPNLNGCDSIITINLTIPILNSTITDAGNGQLVANQTGVTYQWIDCDNANAELVGETSSIFDYSTLLSGNFAVIVSDNGCADTSDCIFVDISDISETNSALISIYPNPTSDNFTVELNQLGVNTTIELVDAQGRIIMKKFTTLNKVEFTTDALPDGLYLVRVSTEGTSLVKSIIVEKK
jgi:hypothetical protein